MSAKELFRQYLGQCPLIAIIRGVTPDEAETIGDAIYESGIRIVEVPLNSPDPLKSIGLLAARLGDRMLVGAGTVLTPDDVRRVGHAGGRLIVSPDTNGDVIADTAAAARARGLRAASLPAVEQHRRHSELLRTDGDVKTSRLRGRGRSYSSAT